MHSTNTVCLAVKTTTRYWWTSEPKINAYNRPFRHITDTVYIIDENVLLHNGEILASVAAHTGL